MTNTHLVFREPDQLFTTMCMEKPARLEWQVLSTYGGVASMRMGGARS
jgi:hypothetical protein